MFQINFFHKKYNSLTEKWTEKADYLKMVYTTINAEFI